MVYIIYDSIRGKYVKYEEESDVRTYFARYNSEVEIDIIEDDEWIVQHQKEMGIYCAHINLTGTIYLAKVDEIGGYQDTFSIYICKSKNHAINVLMDCINNDFDHSCDDYDDYKESFRNELINREKCVPNNCYNEVGYYIIDL